jgi:hypothetical protein
MMAIVWVPELEVTDAARTYEPALDLVQVSVRLPVTYTPALMSGFPARELEWVSSRERAELIMEALGGAVEQDEASRAATASVMEASSQPVHVAGWFHDLPDDI